MYKVKYLWYDAEVGIRTRIIYATTNKYAAMRIATKATRNNALRNNASTYYIDYEKI